MAAAEAEVIGRRVRARLPLRVVEIGVAANPRRARARRRLSIGRPPMPTAARVCQASARSVRQLRIGDEPRVRAELRFEQEHAGAELEARGHGRPPRVCAAEEAHQRGDRVAARPQQRREIDDVVVEAPAVRAHRTARHLDAVHEERVARIRADARRHRRRHRREIEAAPEARRHRIGRRATPRAPTPGSLRCAAPRTRRSARASGRAEMPLRRSRSCSERREDLGRALERGLEEVPALGLRLGRSLRAVVSLGLRAS